MSSPPTWAVALVLLGCPSSILYRLSREILLAYWSDHITFPEFPIACVLNCKPISFALQYLVWTYYHPIWSRCHWWFTKLSPLGLDSCFTFQNAPSQLFALNDFYFCYFLIECSACLLIILYYNGPFILLVDWLLIDGKDCCLSLLLASGLMLSTCSFLLNKCSSNALNQLSGKSISWKLRVWILDKSVTG